MLQTKLMSFQEKLDYIKGLVSVYSKIVVVGFPTFTHSHHYIHLDLTNFFAKLGIKYMWISDSHVDMEQIPPKSLVILPDVPLASHHRRDKQEYLKYLSDSLRSDCYYILHNGARIIGGREHIPFIRLYEYRNIYREEFNAKETPIQLNNFIYFYPETRTLIQPWGTNLLENEFCDPVCKPNTNVIYFVGTIWGDKDTKKYGNVKIIERLGTVFNNLGYNLKIISGITPQQNCDLIRKSFISISPGSLHHNEEDYLQCRTFKNISYGRFTFTDVTAFAKILGKSYIPIKDFIDAVKIMKHVTEEIETEMCRFQQAKIRSYTLADMFINQLASLDYLYF